MGVCSEVGVDRTINKGDTQLIKQQGASSTLYTPRDARVLSKTSTSLRAASPRRLVTYTPDSLTSRLLPASKTSSHGLDLSNQECASPHWQCARQDGVRYSVVENRPHVTDETKANPPGTTMHAPRFCRTQDVLHMSHSASLRLLTTAHSPPPPPPESILQSAGNGR